MGEEAAWPPTILSKDCMKLGKAGQVACLGSIGGIAKAAPKSAKQIKAVDFMVKKTSTTTSERQLKIRIFYRVENKCVN